MATTGTTRSAAARDAAQRYEQRLLELVRAGVADRVREVVDAGGDPAALGDPEQLAARMVAALPRGGHRLDVELGPFYDTAGLCEWWAVSRQALSDRVRRGRLLACRTADGHLVYPAFQFARDGAVRPGIVDVVAVFTAAGVDGWTTAAWLTTPTDVLDGDSAVDHLVVHRAGAAAVQRVLEQARADAAALAA
ncbi:hypothetical protein [Angustibacter aerolatus]